MQNSARNSLRMVFQKASAHGYVCVNRLQEGGYLRNQQQPGVLTRETESLGDKWRRGFFLKEKAFFFEVQPEN